MNKFYEDGMHSLARVEEACTQRELRKAEDVSKGALSSFFGKLTDSLFF